MRGWVGPLFVHDPRLRHCTSYWQTFLRPKCGRGPLFVHAQLGYAGHRQRGGADVRDKKCKNGRRARRAARSTARLSRRRCRACCACRTTGSAAQCSAARATRCFAAASLRRRLLLWPAGGIAFAVLVCARRGDAAERISRVGRCLRMRSCAPPFAPPSDKCLTRVRRPALGRQSGARGRGPGPRNAFACRGLRGDRPRGLAGGRRVWRRA